MYLNFNSTCAIMLSTLTILFVLSLGSIPYVSSYQIPNRENVAYDCDNEGSNITAISTHDVEDCPLTTMNIKNELSYVLILHREDFTSHMVRRCKLTSSSLIHHCGIMSHAIPARGALSVNEVTSLPYDVCNQIIATGIYKTRTGNVIADIKINASTRFTETDIGSIGDKSCSGVDAQINGVYYTSIVRTVSHVLLVDETLVRREVSTNKVYLPTGARASYSIGSFIDPQEGTWVWAISDKPSLCGTHPLSKMYSGIANITRTDQKRVTIIVDDNDARFAITSSDRAIVCGRQGYKTEGDYVYMIIDEYPIFIKEDFAVKSVDQVLNTNLKFIYLERRISNRTEDLYQVFTRRYCDMNKSLLSSMLSLARTDPEEFATVYTKSSGYTAISKGDVIYLIQCVKVKVELRPTNTCYNEIPVTFRNSSMFVKPSSGIIIHKGNSLPCNPLTPPLYKIGDRWIKLSGDKGHGIKPLTLKSSFDKEWAYGEISSVKKNKNY